MNIQDVFNDKDLDDLYDHFHDMFVAGKFEEVNRELEVFSPATEPSMKILGTMIWARIAQVNLPIYRVFMLRCIAELNNRPEFDKRAIEEFKREIKESYGKA